MLSADPIEGPVRRWHGRSSPPGRSGRPARRLDGWASVRPASVPRGRVRAGAVLGDLAAATAGFRDEFYGIAAAVGDGVDGPKLVTSGLIDPGVCRWGERPYVSPVARSCSLVSTCRRSRPRSTGGCAGSWSRRFPRWGSEQEVWHLAAVLTNPVTSAVPPTGRGFGSVGERVASAHPPSPHSRGPLDRSTPPSSTCARGTSTGARRRVRAYDIDPTTTGATLLAWWRADTRYTGRS